MSDAPKTTATRPSADYPVWLTDFDGSVRHGYDQLGRFVNGPDDVVIFDEVPRLLHDHALAGGVAAGVTNQSGVFLGHMTAEQNLAALEATRTAASLNGRDPFFAVAYCPHDSKGDCWCRKPQPGMVLFTMYEINRVSGWDFGRDQALFIGDRPEDRACAERAGIDFRLASEWRAGQ